jgi:hypothetical protein
MNHNDKLVKKKGSYETYNHRIAVNALISGGIEPVRLLAYRYLLSQNGKRYFINTSEQGKYVSSETTSARQRHVTN